jgi:hypothetical protein
MGRRGINALALANAGEKTPPPWSPSPVTERTNRSVFKGRSHRLCRAFRDCIAGYAQELFVPLMLAMLIAFALNPFVWHTLRVYVRGRGEPRTSRSCLSRPERIAFFLIAS